MRVGHNDDGLLIAANVFDDDIQYSRNPGQDDWQGFDSMRYEIEMPGGVYTVQSMTRHWEDRNRYSRLIRPDGTIVDVDLDHKGQWYGDAPNQAVGNDRGWFSIVTVPWSALGGQPTGQLPLTITNFDRDLEPNTNNSEISILQQSWSGMIDFDSLPQGVSGAELLKFSRGDGSGIFVGDAHVGGAFDCGVEEKPDFFSTWGNASYPESTQVNVQSQMNTEDWPCFSRYIIWFELPASVSRENVSRATLTMYLFGNAGYAWPHDGLEPIPNSQIQAIWIEVPEAPHSWNNSPEIKGHLDMVKVSPLPVAFQNPPLPVTFDITHAIKNSAGRTAIALYSADWNIHSGKYFWSSYASAWRPEIVIEGS